MGKVFFNLTLTLFLGGTFAMFVAGAVLGGCNKPEDKMNCSKQTIYEDEQSIQAGKDMDTQVIEYKAKSEEKIKSNEGLIAAMKENAKTMKQEVKAQYEKTVLLLEKRNEDLKEKLKNYKQETKEGWESFTREFNHDMTELGTALKDLAKDNAK